METERGTGDLPGNDEPGPDMGETLKINAMLMADPRLVARPVFVLLFVVQWGLLFVCLFSLEPRSGEDISI